MKIFHIQLIFFFLIWIIAINGFSAEKVGRIKNINGSVSVEREGKAITARLGTIIMDNDVITTDKSSTAGVVFNDNTMITLGENSVFKVAKYLYNPQKSEYAFEGNVQKGKVVYSSGTIAKIASNNVKMKTPTAIIGVKGTKFIVDVAE